MEKIIKIKPKKPIQVVIGILKAISFHLKKVLRFTIFLFRKILKNKPHSYCWRLNLELMGKENMRNRDTDDQADAWSGHFFNLKDAIEWAENYGKTEWKKYPLILFKNNRKTEITINHEN